MGYELNIVRLLDNEKISNGEWISYLASDEDLSSPDGDGYVTWTGHPSQEAGLPWFKLSDGCIFSKNPDFYVISKMLLIAKALDAVVQGEEGETYDEDFLAMINPA